MRKIKKGDEVIAIAGKDKGKKGTVSAVLDGGKKLLIEGINSVKKHVKANPNANEQGGIVLKTLPINSSNVMLFNPATQKGSRVGIRTLESGEKVRYFKSTNDVIDVGA
jgi:large subunit ribosomal protein L24